MRQWSCVSRQLRVLEAQWRGRQMRDAWGIVRKREQGRGRHWQGGRRITRFSTMWTFSRSNARTYFLLQNIKKELAGGAITDSRESGLSDLTDYLGCSKAISCLTLDINPQVALSPSSDVGGPKRLAADQVICARPMGLRTRDVYVLPREPVIEKSGRPKPANSCPPKLGLQACATRPGEKRVSASFFMPV
jgi:hypothetical protein